MKIQLIYPDVSSCHGLPYHAGLASIAAVLKSNGHDVMISYFDNVDKADRVLSHVTEYKPDVVGFTAVETQFAYARDLACRIKDKHQCAMVCGGVYTTLFPEVVAHKENPFDAVFRGESEYAMAEFVGKLARGDDWLNTRNLAYRDPRSGIVVKNPLNPLMDNLDLLPYPAVELFPIQEIIDQKNIIMFHFGRGCPFHCAFCSNEALGKVYGFSSNPIRQRSTKSVINEIVMTLSKYTLRDDTLLHFGDDLFISDKEWLTEFCVAYKKKVGRPFWCTGRSNYINDSICATLKDAGCATLMMSVESGNDYIRNEVMARNISRQMMFRSFELCHKHGINTLATCIIGLPLETPEMIEDSIKTVAQLKSITSYGINIFYPYCGTRLRKICEENGLLPERIDKHFVERRGSILQLPDLPKEKLEYYYSNWEALIMKHKSVGERAKYAARRLCNRLRKTTFGQKLFRIINDTGVGRKFKKIIMKRLWNRA